MCKAFVFQNWKNIHIADIPKLSDIIFAIRLRWRYGIGVFTMDI